MKATSSRIPLAPLLFASAAILCAAVSPWSFSSPARLAPQQPPETTTPTLRFAHGGSAAEVPMELAASAVFVPVQINQGRPADWLLDTGSPRSLVAQAPAADSAGNQVGAFPTVLSLPGLAILGARLAAGSFERASSWYGLRVEGVIGDDLLRFLVVELDYERRSIELYQPASFLAPSHAQKLEIRWLDGLPTVHARLRLGGRTVEGEFALETGSSAAVLLSNRFLDSQRMYPYEGKTIPGTIVAPAGEAEASLVRAEWFQLGSTRIPQPIVAFEPGAEASAAPSNEAERTSGKSRSELAGWLGGEILRKFSFVLNFPQGYILYAPNRDFIFPIPADASGAAIAATQTAPGAFEVRRVVSGSPAAAAGLQPGDRIAVIDSEPASDLTLDQVRALLSEAGKSPVLSVIRGGKKLRIELHLREIL